VEPEIYNLIWVSEGTDVHECAVSLQASNTVARETKVTKGVILFPAFMTPLVYVEGKDEPWLDLLIVTEKELNGEMVNRQLKISKGLSPEKPYDRCPLFGGAKGHIELAEISTGGDKPLKSHHRFEGILHPSVVNVLKDAKLTKYYKVKINTSALTKARVANEKYREESEKDIRIEYTEEGEKYAKAFMGKETHDELIRIMLERRFKESKLAGQGRYTFRKKGRTVNHLQADPQKPIQSYHPIVVYKHDALDYAHIAHVSDIHINARWQLLAKSPARVIEDDEQHNESPKIGELLGQTNLNFHNVLQQVSHTGFSVSFHA